MTPDGGVMRHGIDFKRVRPAVGARKQWIRKVLRGVLLTLAVLGVLFAAVAVPAGIIAASVASRAALAKHELQSAERAIADLDLDSAVAHLNTASVELSASRRSLRPLLPLEAVPYIGPRIHAADEVLRGGERAAAGLIPVLESVRVVVSALGDAESLSALLHGTLPEGTTVFRDLTPERKRDILAALADLGPRLRVGVVELDNAVLAIDAAAAESVAGDFGGQLTALRSRIVGLRDQFAAAAPIAELLPATLGHPEAKRYLLFFQNNTELRPTGGFLGLVAVLTIRDAEIADLDVRDVYAYDGPSDALPRPAPPDPIRKYIGIDKWFLRDANWSPDFGASSALMERFYKEEAEVIVGRGNAPKIDGVIAFTPEPAADLLRLVGPITVDGVKFDADNLVDELEFQVEQQFAISGIDVNRRKDIIAKLVQELIHRVTSLKIDDLRKVTKIVEQNLAERHVLLSSHDPSLQGMILSRDWGGTLRVPEGDALMVVDANLASLKTDPTVRRTVQYSIAPDGRGNFVADVKIAYRHTGHFDWKTTRYRTYTRVYVPAGSAFLSVTGALVNDKLHDPRRTPGTADVGEELGRAVFGAFISIEPGETRTLEFKYRLPASVARQISGGRYLLDVEKQSGTPGSGLTLDLDFGKKVRTAAPAEDRSQFGDSRYRVTSDLTVDRRFEVGL